MMRYITSVLSLLVLVLSPGPAAAQTNKNDDFATWLKKTKTLPAEDRAVAVIAKLVERNPGLTPADVKHVIADGELVELTFPTRYVSDISPLRAATELRKIHAGGDSGQWDGALKDISPLRELKKLNDVYLSFNKNLADLSALKGMKLTRFCCERTQVQSLSILKGMQLEELNVLWTQVRDLGVTRKMPIKALHCQGCTELAMVPAMPLESVSLVQCGLKTLDVVKDKKLTHLVCSGNPITDLSPLKGMKLKLFYAEGCQIRNLGPLQGMPLEALLLSGNQELRDLTAIAGMELKSLHLSNTNISKLEPLVGMPLNSLFFDQTDVEDLSPLRTLTALHDVRFSGCKKVSDLTPLKGLKIARLELNSTAVKDLSPLSKLPIHYLLAKGLDADPKILSELPLQTLSWDLRSPADVKVIESLPNLRLLNNRPPREVINEYEMTKGKKKKK